MWYESARSELRSPPARMSFSDLVVEAGAVILASLALVWFI